MILDVFEMCAINWFLYLKYKLQSCYIENDLPDKILMVLYTWETISKMLLEYYDN